MRRNRGARWRGERNAWWRDEQESRELLEHVRAHYTPLDAKTLKRLHDYTARERAGLHPLRWHRRVIAAVTDRLRLLFRF